MARDPKIQTDGESHSERGRKRKYCENVQIDFESGSYLSFLKAFTKSKASGSAVLVTNHTGALGFGPWLTEAEHGFIIWKRRDDWFEITILIAIEFSATAITKALRKSGVINSVTVDDEFSHSLECLGILFNDETGPIQANNTDFASR